MFVLHVEIRFKDGQAGAAERLFAGPFRAAISAQEGFRDVQLLRPTEGGNHVLSIAFETRSLQQQWVATELHTSVWSQMENHIDAYTLESFTAL
jgi:heme-degrading monooxygenase HmoA